MTLIRGRTLATLVAAGAALVLGAGCWPFGGGAANPPPVAAGSPAAAPTQPPPTQPPAATGGGLTGTWVGSWANQTPDTSTGGFTVVWTQQGGALRGSITITGTPCLDSGSITGTVSGSRITFGAVDGQVSVAYTGSVAGNSMSGTYATDCGKARGNWSAARK